MAKPIVGQTSKVVTKPIFDADGNVVAYTEVQNGHQSELMRQNVRHAEDRRLPLAASRLRCPTPPPASSAAAVPPPSGCRPQARAVTGALLGHAGRSLALLQCVGGRPQT